jgi:hypothetical protein
VGEADAEAAEVLVEAAVREEEKLGTEANGLALLVAEDVLLAGVDVWLIVFTADTETLLGLVVLLAAREGSDADEPNEDGLCLLPFGERVAKAEAVEDTERAAPKHFESSPRRRRRRGMVKGKGVVRLIRFRAAVRNDDGASGCHMMPFSAFAIPTLIHLSPSSSLLLLLKYNSN